MTNTYITGANGFVGKNVIKYFNGKMHFKIHFRDQQIKIDNYNVFHFAGIAHDLKKTLNDKIYWDVNVNLTKKIFDEFLKSNAKVFIFLSSIKAVTDNYEGILDESFFPNPRNVYGRTKLEAERYLLSKKLPNGKKVFILRPCMIHGPYNKGNLNLLYKLLRNIIFWPFGKFNNYRSYCSIDNLCFVINELINRPDVPSGIYNVCDSEAISLNETIDILSFLFEKKIYILKIPKSLIYFISKVGDILHLPFNTENFDKLTASSIVSNRKLINSIGKELPISVKDGLMLTFRSLNKT